MYIKEVNPTKTFPEAGLTAQRELEILMEAVIPEHATREGVQKYVARTFSVRLDLLGMTRRELAAICMMDDKDVSEMLGGTKPISDSLRSQAQFPLDLTTDDYTPLNPNLPENKYVDIYTQIAGHPPDALTRPCVRSLIGSILIDRCLAA